jgi:hypothetical protein
VVSVIENRPVNFGQNLGLLKNFLQKVPENFKNLKSYLNERRKKASKKHRNDEKKVPYCNPLKSGSLSSHRA